MWRTTLWDNFDAVCEHVDDGKKAGKSIADYFRKRAELEKEYSRKLASYTKSLTDDFGSLNAAWNVIKAEAELEARQKAELGDAIKAQVDAPMSAFFHDTSKTRKKLVDSGRKVLSELQRSEKSTEAAKAKYERARKKQYEQKDEYEKASFNANVNTKVKEKLARKVASETKVADSADQAYAEEVTKLQNCQVKAYETELPAIVGELESLEKQRVSVMKNAFASYVALVGALPAEMEASVSRMSEVVNAVSGDTDVSSFSQGKTTGSSPPPRAQYEPYDESLGKCVPPQSLSVGFTPGGRTIEAGPTAAQQPPPQQQYQPPQQKPPQQQRRAPPPSSQPAIRKSVGQCRALYDYTGQSAEELSFAEGDIIEVLEKDPSGWWSGVLRGVTGVFPAQDWVEEVFEDDLPPAQSAPARPPPLDPGVDHSQAGRKCQALYDYDARDADELSIVEGEILTIEYEDSGWYFGKNSTGRSGRWPGNYVS